MNLESDLFHLLRSLKGAPAAVLLALILHGGPQTTKHLCRCTGYSDKVVRQGLVRLEEVGLVFNHPHLRAWGLVPQTALLRLLQQALSVTAGPGTVYDAAEMALCTELSTGLAAGEKGAADAEDFTVAAEDFTEAGEVSGRKTAVSPGQAVEVSAGNAEDFAAGTEDFTAGAEESSAAPGYITTTANPYPKDRKVVSRQGRAAQKGLPLSASRERQKILADWLARGGIGRKSPKMLELLASDLDLQTVKAHVLERLAWEAGLTPGRPDFLPGLLIHKLLGGDPPPPMRCEHCLHLPSQSGLCRCDYDRLVHR